MRKGAVYGPGLSHLGEDPGPHMSQNCPRKVQMHCKLRHLGPFGIKINYNMPPAHTTLLILWRPLCSVLFMAPIIDTVFHLNPEGVVFEYDWWWWRVLSIGPKI